MKCKCWIGPIFCLIGLIVVLFATHFMKQISTGKEDIKELKKMMPHNRTSNHIGMSMEGKAGQYDSSVRHMLISGIVLICVGAGLSFLLRKKEK